ncbi:bifunctional 2-C-methyl-D-erythritol 4-phosphate cytidylyltransferase/2-C-methyl-D-erythritol 2,4-cyclodiphosphate synthase [uncultured Roseovarius sp.]|uniref:bifunctional 2-C-methyl-D-erythritol 4-phosphate cytidylyltransferase/2-C-methyl-D-erythritol 2,4-cyclodiphosphate synthase n=1 Tax=uncultured Roseovarius sp. TaxID=293344 RepID=UPI000C630F39|nr:bifunctional 2-C-methyl-D-erythritol 4-phosphate cytidylyltransferase/2-C-methyl-D-erythritol 2,4-cyclodiphosphate synthase [Roseovarius sp.]MBD13399.1 bifunctional 2-C-methyl-D-erythritol 4-phosphate cytidylyltransferase/2-C-methyl-D-erythritol 2,4-cyclodiphosphate synthase [Roseovarius sp.]|tara:strand:+ start:1251 stop:2393 length:1143 start_codon:yes stop_codon:yes gene_type:complete
MTTAALIVAAGRGTRAGGDCPKQWQPLLGRRVIDWTLDAFLGAEGIDRILVVLHPDDLDRLAPDPRILVTTGGATRAESVRNGLEALASDPPDHVLIHDVARCCTKSPYIAYITYKIRSTGLPALAPALPVTDALWTGAEGRVTGTRDRTGLYRAQTPQAFDFAIILSAHRARKGDAADDVAVARAAGIDVTILDGDEDNLKITHPHDFKRAEKILGNQMDIRVGSGYDVHRFGPGDHCMLCGVAVPHDRGLQGHSDADVGLHALADAIYGGLAQGDIGRHFPPSDPQWKGAKSHIFLRHAVGLADELGFKINNIDVTLVCERPKITPHAPAMQAALSEITGVAPDRISVKATTSERLGFTGREEGIAAQAVVTLVKPCA